ncbi:uncharacterized protein LOC125336976 isoform X7 [Corvus hawaiiensis]|uniref:uncharacterized protein LOC125336976 isoform X5 n=1 Tax=Corvus hawaiiensis TaxID=134902 RepID=UPI002019CC7F|nr:uncharacterized protein LOC125336976 isoform X5 [Corvus hawaiiensis]XP_048182129.1 uncharacterized protein LOC125336976 isoform X6 [Corvus hawaiiensis]XP_048182130.1 uncharacterized protein LOC125336976 isoform X7 [Corvus hawaiiensis]
MGLFPASLLGVEGALLPSRALFHSPDGLPEPRDNGKGRWEWAPGVGSTAGWRLWVFLQRDSLEAGSSKGIPWKHTVPKGFHGNTSFLLSCGCLSKGIPWKPTIPSFLCVFLQSNSLEAHNSKETPWKHIIPQGFHGNTQFPLSCGCLSKGIPWKHTIPAFLCVFLQSNSLEAHNSKEIPWKHIIPQGFHGSTQFPLSCGCLSKGIHWKHTIPEGFHGSTQFQRDSLEAHNPLFRFNLVPPPRSAGLFPGLQKSHKNVEFRPAGALSPFDPDQSPAPKGVLLQGWEGSLLLRRPAPGQAALPGETEAGMGQT